MSITSKHLAKAERQYVLTCESSQPVRIEAMHVTQITPSKASDVATVHPYAITNTAGPPANMHANITGSSFTNQSATITIRDHGVELGRIDKHGMTESLIRSVDLEKDVFKVPIDTLINIWVTRFGNEWVDLETIDEDDFFINAYKRLKQLGHLEQHYLTDRSRYVCRKPE